MNDAGQPHTNQPHANQPHANQPHTNQPHTNQPHTSAGEPIVARTTGAEHTKAVGAALAGVLAPGDVVLLVGDLGAGKTTFAQGLAAGLGVDEAVTSPTFTLVRPYLCAGAHRGVRTMLHADLYRLDSWQEVADLALGEMVEDGAVAIVEWGDVAEPVLGPDPVTVRLAPGPSDEERTVSIALPARHRPHLESLRAQVLSAGTAA